MRKLFREFKQFISKGNIIDLAIAVVLGNAFNKIVNSLVNSVIMPFIGYLTGGASVADWKWVIREANPELGITENAVQYGVFLQAIIDFLIIAICLFTAMKIVSYSRKKIEKTQNILKKELKELTKWDRKRLRKQGVDIDALGKEGGKGTIEELIKKSKTVEQPKIVPPPTEEQKLLTEIRDLLAGKIVAKEGDDKEEAVKDTETEE